MKEYPESALYAFSFPSIVIRLDIHMDGQVAIDVINIVRMQSVLLKKLEDYFPASLSGKDNNNLLSCHHI